MSTKNTVETAKADILAAFDEWDRAIQTGNPDEVTALYHPTAVLLPTMSNQVRHNPAEIRDYFVQFLALGPKGHIDEANIQIFADVVINSGIYTFSFADGSKAQARFTYSYVQSDGRWLIMTHHSSAMPEG